MAASLEPHDRAWVPYALAGVLVAVLFAMRLAAPSNFLDQDQENPAVYVLDVVKNGSWICQRDLGGGITSKPPFYTWCAALTSLAVGRVNLFTLYLPGAAALLGSAWLVMANGRKHFGATAGLFGALTCILCSAGLKEIGLARTDGVFAFMVTAAALLANRAWTLGRGWTWFWVVAAGASLTKGPLGLVLAASGLIAVVWEKRSGDNYPLHGRQMPGVILFVVLTVGWLFLAWLEFRHALIDKLFLQELVFHVVEGEEKKPPGTMIYLSPLYYLARSAPWSLLAYYGLWRVTTHPAADLRERRFERFVFCWFVIGLFLFSMAPHQRGDLLWPIMPAGAILAGRELGRLTEGINLRRVYAVTAVVVLAATAGFTFYYFGPHARKPLVQQTRALEEFARELESRAGSSLSLTHVDDPAGLQFYLNTFVPTVSFAAAAERLRGVAPAYIAVNDVAKLQAARASNDPPFFVLLEDRGPVERLKARLVSNRPALPP